MGKYVQLEKLAKLIRYWVLISTTEAGSGHPTSSLSATDLMTALVYGGFFRFDPRQPELPNNDRLIFSKGHAAPLLYALWAADEDVAIDEENLLTLRKFDSPFQGHPAMEFPYTEAATGSLGQGLSIGVGMAINAKYIDKLSYRTFVLLGDSEMAEGSVWEAIQLAAYYKLDNLIGIIDVNRLGQCGETMYGHDINAYKKRIASFGWEVITTSRGHAMSSISRAYTKALKVKGKPAMIIAKTVKGKGVSFLEDKSNWHGRSLEPKQLVRAVKQLDPIDETVRGSIKRPLRREPATIVASKRAPAVTASKALATRKAYGIALARLRKTYPHIVALDAETSNSTYSQTFGEFNPKHFFEMFIAEQNMAGVALGLAQRGKIPFASTFAAFWSRAYDQIRMAAYSNANIKFVGSHAGVSIGHDGFSQMGLEDIAMFRSIHNSVVLHPADAAATEKLTAAMAVHEGIAYLRTLRPATPILYKKGEKFQIGGSKVLRKNTNDTIAVIGAGLTVHEALAAYAKLQAEGIFIRVIDCYSIKPLDIKTLEAAANQTRALITVEDHYPAGGLGEAVKGLFTASRVPIVSLAVKKMPRSGMKEELYAYEGIDSAAIVRTVKELLCISHK